MKKDEFLSYFSKDDRIIAANLFEKIETTSKKSLFSFSNDFLKPSIWKQVQNISSKLKIKVYSYGVYQNSERRVLAFSDIFDDLYDYNYPLNFIKVSYKNKFKEISHRQFMGIITSSGIKREKYGDIIKKDNIFYFPCIDDISEYTINFLESNKEDFDIEILDISVETVPEASFEDLNFIVSSMRLDSILSKITKKSRSQSEDFIRSGKILIDYEVNTEKKTILKDSQILTIRGIGKFMIKTPISKTKKDNLKILIKKFT